MLVNHFVEDVRNFNTHMELVARNTLNGEARFFQAKQVILAAGSIESPKLLRRSSLYSSLPPTVQELVGKGLTDHPTTTETSSHDPCHIQRETRSRIVENTVKIGKLCGSRAGHFARIIGKIPSRPYRLTRNQCSAQSLPTKPSWRSKLSTPAPRGASTGMCSGLVPTSHLSNLIPAWTCRLRIASRGNGCLASCGVRTSSTSVRHVAWPKARLMNANFS